MSWVRYDDTQCEHPKVVALGVLEPLAGWLNHRVTSWCCRHHTDGHFTRDVVERQAASLQLERYRVGGKAVTFEALADRLLAVGLWETTEKGYVIHDFLDFQRSRAQAEQERTHARERMRVTREHKRNSGDGSANVPPNFGRSSDCVRLTPSRPVPSPSVSEPSVGSLPSPSHKIPAEHALEEPTRQIYLLRGCQNTDLCHGDFVNQQLAAGQHRTDWHAAERRWAQRHDERAVCHRRPVAAVRARERMTPEKARLEREAAAREREAAG